MPSIPPPETHPGVPEPAPAVDPGPVEPERRPDEPPWPIWTAVAAIAAGFGLGIVVSVIVGIVAQASGSSITHPTAAVSLIGDFLFDVAFVVAALYFARLTNRIRPGDFGFRSVRLRTAVTSVVAAGLSYYILTAVYASLLKLHGNEKLPKELGVSKSTAALVGATIFVCVVAPVAAEFFFRGFFFGALRTM